MQHDGPHEPHWIAQAMQGHRASLARAITAAEEDNREAAAVLQAAFARLGRALVVGFTGTPGAGKSTLIGACITEALRRDLSVAVVAVDPSSPVTGGSVLGDRIRMLPIASDPRVFVRSLSARGHLGGLSTAAGRVVDILDAAGKDLIFVESVGVGQSETEISRLAHVTVLVCAPGMGDEVQMLKAGVLEIADVYVVNKADLPGGQQLMRQLQAVAHRGESLNPVIPTSALQGSGVSQLLDAVRDQGMRLKSTPDRERLRRVRRALETHALQYVQRRMSELDTGSADALCQAVLSAGKPLDQAARELLVATLEPPR